MSKVLLIFSLFTLSQYCLAQGNISRGEDVYNLWCVHCHEAGEGYSGTHMLSLSRGESLAVMKDNQTLVPVYIETVVRKGLGMMPPIRHTEVTEEQMEDLIAFLLSEQ